MWMSTRICCNKILPRIPLEMLIMLRFNKNQWGAREVDEAMKRMTHPEMEMIETTPACLLSLFLLLLLPHRLLAIAPLSIFKYF